MVSAFYLSVLRQVAIPADANVLVVCGGSRDRDVLLNVGITHATISNLDTRRPCDEFTPYERDHQDAEKLSYADNSFDYVVEHAGLHHCASPHRALLEMYRVARRGVVAIEARDNLVIHAAKRLGFVPEYEVEAVIANRMQWGGVRNTSVPNYVYRWTENEVIKTIHSYAPHARHEIQFFYGLNLPEHRLRTYGTKHQQAIVKFVEPAVRLFTRILPKQCNLMGFYIAKPGPAALQPWMKSESEFNPQYELRGTASRRSRNGN